MKAILYIYFGNWRWARRLHGGKWELWWVDPCRAYIWLSVADFHAPGTRPAGTDIFSLNPRPAAREEYKR